MTRDPLFLSIGESMVELSPGAGDDWRLGYAGDSFNTAWYARRTLGPEWRVGYLTRIGTDKFSDAMADFIADAGIEDGFLTRDADRGVGLYAISLDRGERSFTYWRGQSAARRLADDRAALDAAFAQAAVLYLSGITLAVLEGDGRQTLIDALAAARAGGARVVFDPNLRPRLWASLDEMRDWVMRAAGQADLVLPSFDDEAQHFGDADPQATIARLHGAGAGMVVVKNGGGAVHFAGRDTPAGSLDGLKVSAPVDTTAAGDSFNAGFLAAWLDGAPIRAAIRAGHAIASQVVMQRGALCPVDLPADPLAEG